MQPRERGQVEESLGRPLVDEELVVVDDLASMPESHFAIIEALYPRDMIGALYYVTAIRRDGDASAARKYLNRFDEVLATRRKRAGLRDREMYENKLGRKLTAQEANESEDLDSLNDEQRALAALLARKDRGLALAYLHDVARFATSLQRQVFLEALPKR